MSDYGFTHGGKVFTPNGSDVAASDVEDRNKAIERAELDAWKDQPIAAIGYYSFPNVDTHPASRPAMQSYRGSFYPDTLGATVTTWLGTILGRITSARVHTNNFGARIVAMTVVGTNGARYSGRASWDNGSVIRLQRMKKG